MRATHTSADAWDWTVLRTTCRREARRLLHDPHDAEDAAQESLLRAWRQRHGCLQPEDPSPWVRQIARREALRLLERRRLAEARGTGDDADLLGLAAPEGPDLERRLDVRSAVRRLCPEDRVLVHARYVNDLTQPSAASLLGMPEGTAKIRLHRLRKRLREELEVNVTALASSSV